MPPTGARVMPSQSHQDRSTRFSFRHTRVRTNGQLYKPHPSLPPNLEETLLFPDICLHQFFYRVRQRFLAMDEETGASGRHAEAGTSSRYKGVRLRKWGKWVSEIRLPNSRERIWLGSYDSPEKAARAFDAALYCLRGQHAQFNFPETPPDIAGAQGLTPHEIRAVAARFANEAPESSGQSRRNDDGHGRGQGTSRSAGEGDNIGSNDMDWSFLNALDDNDCTGSGYGLYGGLDYAGGHEFEPPPQAPATENNTEDENGGDGGDGFYFHQPSFLWNF